MQNLRFRAWDTVENKMIDNLQDRCGMSADLKCPNHIIMQYTGLKDENVWESDIILFRPKDHSTDVPQKAVVEYCEKRACFIAHSDTWLIPLSDCRQIKVIGNIHENPEELKG